MSFADTRISGRVPETRSQSAFTLIELLMVMVVIGILSALLFGIATGVNESQNKARAKAEMAVIAQALEQFKVKYGDYPWIHVSNVDIDATEDQPGNKFVNDASHQLLKALSGWQTVDGKQVGETALNDVTFKKAAALLDVGKMALSEDWQLGHHRNRAHKRSLFGRPLGECIRLSLQGSGQYGGLGELRLYSILDWCG